jgi:hypothetical protein
VCSDVVAPEWKDEQFSKAIAAWQGRIAAAMKLKDAALQFLPSQP